jgi:hypothetical protein
MTNVSMTRYRLTIFFIRKVSIMNTRNRDAGTGKFISDDKAKRMNPNRWVKETIPVPKPTKPKK